jgi:hypothetical protein
MTDLLGVGENAGPSLAFTHDETVAGDIEIVGHQPLNIGLHQGIEQAWGTPVFDVQELIAQ